MYVYRSTRAKLRIIGLSWIALFVSSCCNKSGASCYHLHTRLMTVTDLLQVVLTRLIHDVPDKLFIAINFLATCYVKSISDLLEQLVANLHVGLINLVTR